MCGFRCRLIYLLIIGAFAKDIERLHLQGCGSSTNISHWVGIVTRYGLNVCIFFTISISSTRSRTFMASRLQSLKPQMFVNAKMEPQWSTVPLTIAHVFRKRFVAASNHEHNAQGRLC